jgi:hypothetical protein
MHELLKLLSNIAASRVGRMTCLALPPLALGRDGLIPHTIARSSSAQPWALARFGFALLRTYSKWAGKTGGSEQWERRGEPMLRIPW